MVVPVRCIHSTLLFVPNAQGNPRNFSLGRCQGCCELWCTQSAIACRHAHSLSFSFSFLFVLFPFPFDPSPNAFPSNHSLTVPIWKCCLRQKRIIVLSIWNLWYWDAARIYHTMLPSALHFFHATHWALSRLFLCGGPSLKLYFTTPTPFLRSGSQYHSLPPIFRVRTIVFPGFFPYFLFSCSMNPMRPYDDAGSEPRGFRMKFRHEAPPEWTLNHASMCGLMCCLQRRSNPLFF